MTKSAPPAALAAAVMLASPLLAQNDGNSPMIDQRSYNLGIMGGFAEVVKLGVKKLALSEVMSPEEMECECPLFPKADELPNGAMAESVTPLTEPLHQQSKAKR